MSGDVERHARRAAWREARRRRRLRVLGAGAALLVVVATAGLLLRGRGEHRGARAGAAPRVRPPPGARPGAAPLTRAAAAAPGIAAPRPGRARVVVSGSPHAREVALTFDDGFCAACVGRIVDVLWRTGAHATLFPNGAYSAAWDPQAPRIRAMIERGQVLVGNHTFAHHDPRAESAAAFGQDLGANERWIERTFGVTGRPWFRPPYGSYDAGTLALAGAQGYRRVVLWSGTLADSTPQTVPYLLKATRDWGRPGTIILAHGNYPNTARALPQIIGLLEQRHLRLVTLAELHGAAAGIEGLPTSASPAIPVR